MARSINETLGALPSGRMVRLSTDQVTRFLRDRYKTGPEDDRKKEARKRLDLYRDRGRRHIEAEFDRLFKNAKVRQWRKDFIALAEFQNLTRRVVREISAVYSEPATRKVRAANVRYQDFQRVVRLDRKMRQVNRYGNLLNHCLVWPDVDEGVPVLRTVTPDRFSAVAHPNDPMRPVGYVIDQFPGGLLANDRSPHYLVMTEFEFFKLDKDWRFVEGTYQEHGLGRLPALLWSREEADDCLIDGSSGRDLTSAHLSIALLNALMLKHQKSGTKMAYASGDTAQMASGQPMDEEHLLQTPEGTSLSTLDLGADPSSYISAARAVIKQVAANYGIPESVFDLSYQATSGFEIELKRTGLREIRRDQILDFRPFERELADLWAVVLSKGGSTYAFDTAGWSINFGETDAPTSPTEKLAYYSKLEELGLANRVEMYLEMNPESTEEEALLKVEANLKMRLRWVEMFQHTGAAGQRTTDGAGAPRPSEADDVDETDDAEVAA